MKRSRKAMCEAAAVFAAAITTTMALPRDARAIFVSSMEKPTEVDSVHQSPGSGEPMSWTWGDSFDSNQVDHARSPLFATDGGFSMYVHDPNGGFAWGTQYLINNFNEPSNPNETQGIAKFAEVVQTTKVMYDMTTPDGGPAYRSSFAAINYGGGFLDSYNTSSLGKNYGIVSGASPTRTQTYVWDFGEQMRFGSGGQLWPGLTHFIIFHIATTSPSGGPADFYFDNLRFVNENTQVNPTWQAAAAGDWTNAASWANGVPNATGARAIFYGAGNGAVTLDSNVKLGALILDAQVTSYQHIADATPPPIVNYTVSGTGGIEFDATATTTGELGEIFVIAGNHNINVPVTFTDDTRIDTTAGFGPDSGAPINPNPNPPPANLGRTSQVPVTSLSFGGAVTIASGKTLSTGGAGSVAFVGGISGSGGTLNIRGGTATLAANATLAGLTMSPLAKLTVDSGGGSNRVLNASTINSIGTLDLKDNKLITNSPAGTVSGGIYSGLQGQVQNAYDFGAWDKAGLTTSMPDALAGLTTIGIATGEQVRGLGPSDTDTFAGQTINGASVIAMYTYAGDANLDGTIDGGDYGIIDNFVQIPNAAGYANGDFNYDGVIDGGDYGIIDNNIQAQGAPFPTSGSAGLAGVTTVPEPAACGFALFAGAAALLRRGRRRA